MINMEHYIDYAFSTPFADTLDAAYSWLLENLDNLHCYSYKDVTTMMHDTATLVYAQYEQAYDDAYEQHLIKTEDDRNHNEFVPRSFAKKLRFKDWRRRSDYSIAKKYVWSEVCAARQRQREAQRRVAYYAITTHNPVNGWYILAVGYQRDAVEHAGYAQITGDDLYADTYRKNLHVVSEATLKHDFGFKTFTIVAQMMNPGRLGFTSLIEEEE